MRLSIFFTISLFLFGDIAIVNENLELKKSITSWIEFKNQNLIRQKYDYSCGSASLATILRYFYNLDITEKDILKEIVSDKKDRLKKSSVGLSFFELGEFAKRRGFRAVGLALDLDALKNLKIPVIIYVKIRNNAHFTVFKGIDRRYVYLADPSLGNIKVKISKFKEMFYQRDNIKYRGKILAILPLKGDFLLNKEFLNKGSFVKIPYEILISNWLFD